MSCCNKNNKCKCDFNIKNFGMCDLSKIKINGRDRTALNWNEISVPEVLQIPILKPDMENIDQVYADAELTSVKLIETPFAYEKYNRVATAFEITAATNALNLADIDVTPIVNAVNAILAIPGLPAIPAVTALQAALDKVVDSAATLTAAVTEALSYLTGVCVLAEGIVLLLNSVSTALKILQESLNALIAAADILALAVAGIPVVGAAVSAAVGVLLALVNTAITAILDALTAIAGVILVIGNTSYFTIKSNEEGTCMSGRKLVIEGVIKQKVIYTGLVETQSVHSAHYEMPFSAYIIPYAKFECATYEENVEVVSDLETCTTKIINGFAYNPNEPITVDLCEEFCVDVSIEDIFACMLDPRTIFKNVTLFLYAKPAKRC